MGADAWLHAAGGRPMPRAAAAAPAPTLRNDRLLSMTTPHRVYAEIMWAEVSQEFDAPARGAGNRGES